MKQLDVISDPQIASLMESLGSLSGAGDAHEAMLALTADVRIGGVAPARALLSVNGDGPLRCAVTHLLTDQGVHLPVVADASGSEALSRLTRSPVPKIAHELDLSRDGALPADWAVYRSAMAVPVFVEQVLREWLVLFHREPRAFDATDLREMMLRANLVTATVGNLRMSQQLFQANLRAQHDITAIAEIQRALLPERLPVIPGARLAASYDAVDAAGGDLYDFVPLGRRPGHARAEMDGREDPRWAILIGDVSGHGPAAAVIMAMLHSILHAYPSHPQGPAEVMTHLNRHLCSKRVGRTFATALLAFYDPPSRTFGYCRAGHHPALLLRRGENEPRQLDEVGDLPLGIDATATFEQTRVRLEPGDTLVLYTDGIIEAKDAKGEYFERRRLEAALNPRPADPESAIRHIRQAVLSHSLSSTPADDQTLIAIQVD
jgi:sigma-B regulation protein RsbU (phosphoserine phosphatase)